MSAAQLEFTVSRAPVVSAADVRWFCAMLADLTDWATARELGAHSESERRKFRALADASHGQVISGQRGYRLARLATMEERNHAASWLEHQAAEMQRRAIAIRRLAHNTTDDRREASGPSHEGKT